MPAEHLLVDRAQLLRSQRPEMAVLVGGLRVLGANTGDSKHGVLTEQVGTLSNDFFINLMDQDTVWSATSGPRTSFEAKDRASGELKWTGTRNDLVFGANSILRAIAEVYAADDAEQQVRQRLRRGVGQGDGRSTASTSPDPNDVTDGPVGATQVVRAGPSARPGGRLTRTHPLPTENPMPELSGSSTYENLAEAFRRESAAGQRYLWFAQTADVDGRPDAAALFRSVADGEIGHVHGLLEFLAEVGDPVTGAPIGDTDDNLRAAIEGETADADDVRLVRNGGPGRRVRADRRLVRHDGASRTGPGRSPSGGIGRAELNVTCDPHDAAYLDEKSVRDEMTRVFDVCNGCRRCVDLCPTFPTLFDLLERHEDQDAGRLTPAQQDAVVAECFQCDRCFDGCPYTPDLDDLAVDVPRPDAARRRDATCDRPDLDRPSHRERASSGGRWCSAGSEAPGRLRRAEGRCGGHRCVRGAGAAAADQAAVLDLVPIACGDAGRATPRSVSVFPTCVVEYHEPSIGRALVAVYERNDIACSLTTAGCCGRPWLQAGDIEQFIEARPSERLGVGWP